jgi:hypothetical protein
MGTIPPQVGGTGEPPLPITERILHRLNGRKGLWIVLWALVPLISAFVFATAARWSGHSFNAPETSNLLLTQAAVACACFVLLWGGGALGRQVALLKRELAPVVPGHTIELFRAIGSTRGPLALAVVVLAILTANGWLRYGPLPPLAALPFTFIYLIPILTFVWVYVTILADLNRLGQQPLALDLFPQDRTLGLERVGSVASTGLSLVLVAAVPVMIAGSDEPATVGISMGVVVVTVAIFILSMWRLHRQMAAAKARHIEAARHWYGEAYAPIRDAKSVKILEAQSNALSAASLLEARAHDLLTWPIDEGAVRFIAVVITGVITSLVVRGVFATLGF